MAVYLDKKTWYVSTIFNHVIISFLRLVLVYTSSNCPNCHVHFFGLTFGVGDKACTLIDFFLTEKLWPKSVKKDDHFNTRYLFPSSLPTCLIQAEAGRLKGRAAEVSQAGRWVSAPISQTLCRWQFSKMTPWLGEPHDLMMGNPWQLKMSTSQRSVIFLGAGRRMSCVSEYAWDFPQ